MSSNINISINIHKDYPFDEFVFIMRDCYSRDYIVTQMMKLLVPVRWRRGVILVDGSFISDLLDEKISL
jgi:hypothetical protein